MKAASHTEEWYELQYSIAGAEDWYADNGRFDSLAAAKAQKNVAEEVDRQMDRLPRFDWRVVRKIVTTEPVYWDGRGLV